METLSWYRPGQLVVCIDDTPVKSPDHPPLVLRCVYDIHRVSRSERRPDVICFSLLQHGPFLYPAYLFKPAKPTSIETLLQRETVDAA